MERVLYIPTEAIPDISEFFSLNEDEIGKLINILANKECETTIDLYLDIINQIDVSDDVAASIFSVYNYINTTMLEKSVDFLTIVNDIKMIYIAHDIPNCDTILKNIEINSESFSKLFTMKNAENLAEKKKYLLSEMFNSVINIRSVCSIKPLFNEGRTEIVDGLSDIHIEFVVGDSIGNMKVVPLSFNYEMFDCLLSEIENIKKKIEVIGREFTK